MEPDSIQFDGTKIRIKYHKRQSSTRGWWDGAAMHEIEWLPSVGNQDQVIAHYAKQLPVVRGTPRREQKQRLVAKARFAKCGQGLRVRLSPAMVGIHVACGRDSIYLISEDGAQGSLQLWTCKHQSYSLAKFRIGSIGQWPDLLTLTNNPIVFSAEDAT